MTPSAVFLLLLAPSTLATPGSQCAPLFAGGVEYRFEEAVVLDPDNPGICSSAGFRCETPELVNGPYYQLVSGSCDPVTTECEYQARVDFKLPGNQENLDDDSGANLYNALWYAAETAPICYGSSCEKGERLRPGLHRHAADRRRRGDLHRHGVGSMLRHRGLRSRH